jgi:hypothetical protein
MEWLKKLLGEDLYNKLPKEIIEKFGDTEWVENDPKKIIPKHVFNEKLSKIQLLETEVEQYKTQLKDVGDMVTSKDMQTKLELQKKEFDAKLELQRQEAEKTIEKNNMINTLKNDLIADGCDVNFVDMLVGTVNEDDVIFKDGKILNKDKIVLPLKDTFKKVFETKLTGQAPPANNSNGTPPRKSTKEELIEQYNKAEASGQYTQLASIQRQIKALDSQ